MADELALRKEMDLGAKAERALTDPAIADAFAKVEADLIEAWKISGPRDQEGREMAWLTFRALTRAHDALQTAIDAGKVAQAELKASEPDA